MLTRRTFFTIIVLALMTTICQAQETGLLLGLRQDLPGRKPRYEQVRDRRSRYRTLWITARQGDAALSGERPGLLVSRQAGFYQVGVRRLVAKAWSEDHLWAMPVGETPSFPAIDSTIANTTQGYSDIRILFLGENYVGTEMDTEGYRMTAEGPWAYANLAVYSLDKIKRDAKVHITDLYGPGGGQAVTQAATAYLDSVMPELRKLYTDRTVNTEWALVHRQGRWITRARLQPANATELGVYTSIDVKAEPPPSLVGHETLAIPWKTISARIPDARDAMTSPNKDLLVVLTNTQLRAYALRDGQIGALHLTLPLRRDEAAVMIQWAGASEIAPWTAQVNARTSLAR